MAWFYDCLDSFEWIGSNTQTQVEQRYMQTGLASWSFDTSDKISGTHSLKLTQNFSQAIVYYREMNGAINSVHMGFWVKFQRATAGEKSRTDGDPIMRAYEADGDDQINVSRHITGYLTFFRRQVSGYLGCTKHRVPNNVWHYIELYWRQDDNSSPQGEVVCWVNGVKEFEYSGYTFWGTDDKVSYIVLHGADTSTANNATWFEGLWVRASVDLENEPTPHGFCKVVSSIPDGDGNYGQWNSTASPTQYTEVDDTNGNDTATYISTNTADNKSSFTHAALGLNAGETIKCVGLYHSGEKEAVGGGSHRGFTRVSGADYFLPERYIYEKDHYIFTQEYWEYDPSSSPEAAWTEAAVDAAEFGIEYKA